MVNSAPVYWCLVVQSKVIYKLQATGSEANEENQLEAVG